MIWTKDKPTKEGWYWWRYGSEDTMPLVLNVIDDGDDGLEADGRPVEEITEEGGDWAGPLTTPIESQAPAVSDELPYAN